MGYNVDTWDNPLSPIPIGVMELAKCHVVPLTPAQHDMARFSMEGASCTYWSRPLYPFLLCVLSLTMRLGETIRC